MNTHLEKMGLSERFLQEATMHLELKLGRITTQYKRIYRVATAHGELLAEVSGKFRYGVTSTSDYPAVGDYVMLSYEEQGDQDSQRALIHHVLTRKSIIERRAAGTSHDMQVVAANMDVAFICMALNDDYNLRRLERYLSLVWDSGATPVVLLTKSDLCDQLEEKLEQVASVALGVDVLTTSGLMENGIDVVRDYLQSGLTYVFIGSSGVGKSTIINGLLGTEQMETSATRNDDKGRHTTTHRELFVLPTGGIIIDTPGMRELGLESADLARSFADIEQLASQCKFSDCSHQKEPSCAVQRAVQLGELSQERLASFFKLQKEAKYDGLNSKQIEAQKLNDMFSGVGGMKNARKHIKSKKLK